MGIYESQRHLTSSKTEWTRNATYQRLFDKAKSIIKETVCMKFYDESQLLYLETDVSGIRLRTAYYKPEAIQGAQELKAPTTAYLGPLHL